MKIFKTLVIILNKDNSKGLEKCLNSLLLQSYNKFDILVLDGKSKDNSKEVAKKYGVNFKVQKKLGGTGFARVEGCEYAIEKGYDVVIWGDSENIYHRDYVKEVLKKLEKCDCVGGIPLLNGSFFDHAFAWYHAVHIIIPKLYKKHIPGNNKAEKTWIYQKVMYPESIRAEDYGFSMLLIKKGIKLKQCLANAFVEVSIPENFKEILIWQNSRAKGAAQVLKIIEMKPYDSFAWSLVVLIPVFLLLSSIFSSILIPKIFTSIVFTLIIYSALMFFASVIIHITSKKFIKYFKWYYLVAPLFGLIIYSIYSIKSLIYYFK